MTRAGIVTVVGKPNAGKSTLLNRIMGEKLAIVSDKPQSTRDRVVGISPIVGGAPSGSKLADPGVELSRQMAWTDLIGLPRFEAEEDLGFRRGGRAVMATWAWPMASPARSHCCPQRCDAASP